MQSALQHAGVFTPVLSGISANPALHWKKAGVPSAEPARTGFAEENIRCAFHRRNRSTSPDALPLKLWT